MRQWVKGRSRRDTLGPFPKCTALEVFYWSIEKRVNATRTSAKIVYAIPGLFRGVSQRLQRRCSRLPVSRTRRNNDGFVEFGDVDMRLCWLDGVRCPGSLWHSSNRLCVDAAPTASHRREAQPASGAGAVKAEIRDQASEIGLPVPLHGANKFGSGIDRCQARVCLNPRRCLRNTLNEEKLISDL